MNGILLYPKQQAGTKTVVNNRKFLVYIYIKSCKYLNTQSMMDEPPHIIHTH